VLAETEVLDAAVEQFYDDIESGLSYVDAIINNPELSYALEYSDELEDALIEFYDYILDGATFDEAYAEYEEQIDASITVAVDEVVDLTV
jgi:hypothetical protein